MSNLKTSPGCTTAFGFAIASVVVLTGAFIVLISFNVIPVTPATFHAPRLVVASAGMVFLLMGGWIAFWDASPHAQDTRLYRWAQYLLFLAFMIAFVSVYLWVGLGPGERQFGPVANSGTAGEWAGRLFSAGFGVLVALGTVYYVVRRGRRLLGGEDALKSAPKTLPESGSDRNREG